MKNIAIVYPNQLFEVNYLPYDPKIINTFVIVEDPIYFKDKERNLNFNLLKLIYQRACMKYYQSYLQSKKFVVKYFEWEEYSDMLFDKIQRQFGNNNELHIIDPVDHLLQSRIDKFSKKFNQNITFYETPSFLMTNDELDLYQSKRKNKKFYQYNFYLWHRKNYSILMDDDGKPIGGKYSYDKYNREKIPNQGFKSFLSQNKIKIPEKKYSNKFYDEAIKYCENRFDNYYSENYEPDNIYYYPITHKDSKNHFNDFLRYKLPYFGKYEDAIDASCDPMFHSVISPLQNIGLLTPLWVQERILNYYDSSSDRDSLLTSVEGFIRQLNWREYSRLLYKFAYDDIKGKNYLNNHRHLNENWYNGTTGLEPVDTVIKYAFRNGYLHHILRLMIMCNILNLCQIDPNDAYNWFMEFSLDSYDWVMTNNVYSMGMYADGGLTTTKPYVSSSNYLLRMSNFRKDGVWDIDWKVLYYNFINRNYNKLKGRGKVYLAQWEKQKNKNVLIKNANKLIQNLTS